MLGFGMSAETNILSVEHVQIVALYDPRSGRIEHLHMVSTLKGASPATQEEVIAEAKTCACRRNLNLAGLEVALSNQAEHAYRPHCINPQTKAFVALPEHEAPVRNGCDKC